MSSSLTRISSMDFWSRWRNSLSARTFESTSRRSSSAELYGAGPCLPSLRTPLVSRSIARSSSALRTSRSTNPSSSCRCAMRRVAAAHSTSAWRRPSRSWSRRSRAPRSCCSRSRRRDSSCSSVRRSSRTSRARRCSSPPGSWRATTSKTDASCPRLDSSRGLPLVLAAPSAPRSGRPAGRRPRSSSFAPGLRPPGESRPRPCPGRLPPVLSCDLDPASE
mmetsp:Transcript_26808/g.75807  ORF Transcript_26808/g.75807 Transcript_26808/m.75807 type:complete len:220 (-) Transcript_26808:662-1321(-)